LCVQTYARPPTVTFYW